MSAAPPNPDYDYLAYIDEAGDTGLRTVRPIDPNGSSEWFILSLVLIAKDNDGDIGSWIADIIRETGSHQLRTLHFTDLPGRAKDEATRYLATKPIRAFVICSNKKNMRQYRNVRPERMGVKDWFYCWLTRVALERASHFVWQRSRQKFGAAKRMKIMFSQRGGLRVGQIGAYYDWIKRQSINETLWLPWGDVEWDTVHPLLLDKDYHRNMDGLKLADIVASAFFTACDNQQSGPCDTRYAENLKPIMGRFPHTSSGRYSGYGVKLLPSWSKAKLGLAQQVIFRRYGYPLQLWQRGRSWGLPPWGKASDRPV